MLADKIPPPANIDPRDIYRTLALVGDDEKVENWRALGGRFVVDISQNTTNRLKDYLTRFWLFYNSSPDLQKILATA